MATSTENVEIDLKSQRLNSFMVNNSNLINKDKDFGMHAYYGFPLNILKVPVKICCARALSWKKGTLFQFFAYISANILIRKNCSNKKYSLLNFI